jgi:membrane protease YdiL (CAAX protease family)
MKTRYASPWLFFIVAYAISWALWIPAAMTGQSNMESPTFILFILGGMGPSIAGILLIYLTGDKEARKDFWKRAIDFKQISGMGYFAAILLLPILCILGLWIDVLLGGQAPGRQVYLAGIAQPMTLITFFVQILIFGPLSEELGWRGYAFDGLKTRYSMVLVNVILGLGWLAWHTPLFFITGTDQNVMGIFTTTFWGFVLYIPAQSVLINWVYLSNNRSTLAAILMHFTGNFAYSLLAPVNGRGYIIVAVLFWIAAGILWWSRLAKPASEAGLPEA